MSSFLVLRLVQPLLVDFSCRLLPSLFSTPHHSLHPNSFSSSFPRARIPTFTAPLPLLLSQPMLTNLVSQEMPNLNELFKTVENYEGMTIEQLQVCFVPGFIHGSATWCLDFGRPPRWGLCFVIMNLFFLYSVHLMGDLSFRFLFLHFAPHFTFCTSHCSVFEVQWPFTSP